MPAPAPASSATLPAPAMRWSAAFFFVLLAVLVYGGSLGAPFTMDDEVAIPNNPSIRALWPPGAMFSPPENSTLGGRPLANAAFALNYALGGATPWGYRLGNVLLHAAAGLLLWRVVARTVGRLRHPQPVGDAWWVGFAAAALWVVHPLMTASVTYISQRTEVMMGGVTWLRSWPSSAGWTQIGACGWRHRWRPVPLAWLARKLW